MPLGNLFASDAVKVFTTRGKQTAGLDIQGTLVTEEGLTEE